MALPNAITRPAGAFVLMLVNKTGDPKASFEVRAAAAVDTPSEQVAAVADPHPILQFDSTAPEVRHRRAGLLNLAKGRYELVSTSSDKVLCTITIE